MKSTRSLLRLLSASVLCGALLSTYSVDAHAQTIAPPTTTINGVTWVAVSTPGQLEYIDAHQQLPIATGSPNYLQAHIELTNAITLPAGYLWIPLGNASHPFTGTFNGNHYPIANVTIDINSSSTLQEGGLFGFSTGYITNTDVANETLTNGDARMYGLGLLVGHESGGSVTTPYLTHDVASGTIKNTAGNSEGLGGLAGRVQGTVSDAFAQATVSDTASGTTIGGLVGIGTPGSVISQSGAMGSITIPSAAASSVGGLAGQWAGNIQDTYAQVNVTGGSTGGYVGGLVGQMASASASDSYATGNMQTASVMGQLIGAMSKSSLTDSYALQSGTSPLVGSESSATVTDSSLVSSATLSNAQAAIYQTWDFQHIWGISSSHNSGYPYFTWHYPPAPWTPPVLDPEPVTVGHTTTQVIGNLGYNPLGAVQSGTFVGYVEERAAIEAGASFSGEGTHSAFMSAILSGAGVGLQQHVTATQEGQFAALYQRLGIIPTWTDNTVSIPEGVSTLVKAGASTLAVENYLVQLDGFSWAVATA